ncbi:hypothetical protein, partial [Hydrogenophaga sp.]|uniref:hypothetical protein n=1 Tax=Hydrogenophaga sp. TaxID=1904254 RepID=UPI00403643D4
HALPGHSTWASRKKEVTAVKWQREVNKTPQSFQHVSRHASRMPRIVSGRLPIGLHSENGGNRITLNSKIC